MAGVPGRMSGGHRTPSISIVTWTVGSVNAEVSTIFARALSLPLLTNEWKYDESHVKNNLHNDSSALVPRQSDGQYANVVLMLGVGLIPLITISSCVSGKEGAAAIRRSSASTAPIDVIIYQG